MLIWKALKISDLNLLIRWTTMGKLILSIITAIAIYVAEQNDDWDW